ncbi:MAG: hemolysin D [Planctomycetota bacterium]|nr:MAG: hemolysin D [Planctomycetota bacterium]
MVTLADSLVSSSARRLQLRMRPDLTAQQQRYLGQLYWVVKEPVGLKYFRFQEEEYAILQMLDGQTSLDEIKVEFESRFPPQKITVEELGQFVGMLHRSGLVIANVSGQGEQLSKRRTERAWKEFFGSASNILAMRFKGIDPDRILNWLYPKVRWFFTVPALIICLLFALSALLLVLVQFDTFHNKLPTFHQFFEAKNWIYLGITLAVTKVIHEFGHGLSCKHFGGECHEMGVMLLVLTPCLYCNVSDSWMLPNKYHRAAIGAAGMYVEVVIASICTYLWWFSEPGMLHQLALSTMFVCSVSTLIFNANPLLRYDGYYILSDLAEIPNMRQKASTILSRKLGSWCLGLEEPDDPFLPQRNQALFALYTVASSIYKWFILFGILFFLYKVLEPYDLKIVSQMLAIFSMSSLIGMPLYKVGKFFYVPGRLHQVKSKNIYVTLSILAAVVAFIAFVPLPYRVICPLELRPRGAESVYVHVPGILEEIAVEPGQKVEKDQPLGRLYSPELDLEINELEGQVAQEELRVKVVNSEWSTYSDRSAAIALPALIESLKATKEQLERRKRDRRHLALVAPTSGTVLPSPSVPEQPTLEGRELATWSGSPLQEENLGAYLEPPTVFCQIGDPTQWQADIVIDQDYYEFLEEGQDVEIMFDLLPGKIYSTKIEDIGPEMEFASRQLSSKGGGDLMVAQDSTGAERPISTSYQAYAEIHDDSGVLMQGLRGTAKVDARWQPLGKRLWRWVMRTFNFRL